MKGEGKKVKAKNSKQRALAPTAAAPRPPPRENHPHTKLTHLRRQWGRPGPVAHATASQPARRAVDAWSAA